VYVLRIPRSTSDAQQAVCELLFVFVQSSCIQLSWKPNFQENTDDVRKPSVIIEVISQGNLIMYGADAQVKSCETLQFHVAIDSTGKKQPQYYRLCSSKRSPYGVNSKQSFVANISGRSRQRRLIRCGCRRSLCQTIAINAQISRGALFVNRIVAYSLKRWVAAASQTDKLERFRQSPPMREAANTL
jgi:hypothetical protein